MNNSYLDTALRLTVHTLKATANKLMAYIVHGSKALRMKSWAYFANNTQRLATLELKTVHAHEKGQFGSYVFAVNISVYSYFKKQGHFNSLPFDVETMDRMAELFTENMLKGRGIELTVDNSPITMPYWAVLQLEPQFRNLQQFAKSQQFLKAVAGVED